MRPFRRRLRPPSSAYLACLLCAAALLAGKLGPQSAEARQSASSSTRRDTLSLDEYEKLRAQALKTATDSPGPRLRNPAISSGGLAPGILRALREQRTYLETHGAVRQTALNSALAGNKTFEPPQPSTCREPSILSVNGKARGVVFTPMEGNNTYKIEGCLFGDTPGRVQLEWQARTPHAEPGHPITIQLDSARGGWSDRELTVHLDTALSGISDHSTTLVIHTAQHRRIELPGSRFVAARGSPQLLTVIPAAWVRLYPSGVGSRSISQLEYFSPTQASDAVPRDASMSSAFVVRSDHEQFGIGRDVFDFSRLNPGWVVESIQLQTYGISCPGVVTLLQSVGRWDAEWTSQAVKVAFQDSVCASSVPPPFAFHMSLSQYAIRVWVVGPVGTQPLALVR